MRTVSCAPARVVNELAGARSGMRVFGEDEIVDALAARGFTGVEQRVAGVTQFVGGRRGAARRAA